MAKTIKFHLDENVDPAVAIGLRRSGVDVTTAAEVDLGGASDEQQINYCYRENRVVFTTDTDFLRLHAARVQHNGIVFAHQNKIAIGDAIPGLLLILHALEPNDMRNRLEYL